jgi:hypothetical protein
MVENEFTLSFFLGRSRPERVILFHSFDFYAAANKKDLSIDKNNRFEQQERHLQS